MNRKHLERLGFTDDEYKGEPYGEYHSLQEADVFLATVERVFKTGDAIKHEHKSERDGKYFLRTFSPVRDRSGTITAVTVISKDITDHKAMQEKLHALSITDELTGLFNRRGFYTLAEQQLKLSKRQNRGIHMLYVDLDDLKMINDTFGHQEGDNALNEAAALLKECFRNSDVIARVGGDEFIVIPVGVDGDHVEEVIARLMKKVESYNEKAHRTYTLSFSVGTAFYDPSHPRSLDELLILADRSMYEYKRKKRK
jgi:diguanylate cyclase (GGDEF)-like protein/PAS domain S-box-containing protein